MNRIETLNSSKIDPNFNLMVLILLMTALMAMGLITATLPDNSALELSGTEITASTSCQPRADWLRYTLRDGESLETLAWQLGVSVEILTQANCIETQEITLSSVYVPAFPQS